MCCFRFRFLAFFLLALCRIGPSTLGQIASIVLALEPNKTAVAAVLRVGEGAP